MSSWLIKQGGNFLPFTYFHCKDQPVSLFKEIIAFYFEDQPEHLYTRCGQNVEFLGAFTKLSKAPVSFVMPFCPHERTRLPLNGFRNSLYCGVLLKYIDEHITRTPRFVF
jgi:hypothetical protein